jgi:large subunit ribosomal protein L13
MNMDYHIDAKNKILGRVATEIAVILQGKKSVAYAPNRVGADKVFVSNVEGIRVTGAKATDKTYYRHTGYVGHLKELSFEQKVAKDPRSVLRQAVRKMLPKNFLNQQRIKNLVFVESVASKDKRAVISSAGAK